MADIGKAYVEIIPKAPGISGKVAGLLAPESKSAGEKAGKEAGNGFGSSIKKTLAGLAIGMLVSWFLDKIHVSAGTNFLDFLGEFTMEIYMMNVTMCWVMQRLEPLWQGKIDINLIYWIVCVVIAVLIAWAVHVLAGKIIAKLTHAENSKA